MKTKRMRPRVLREPRGAKIETSCCTSFVNSLRRSVNYLILFRCVAATLKITILVLLQNLLAGFALRRPWSARLSNVVDTIQVRLDALRAGGGGR